MAEDPARRVDEPSPLPKTLPEGFIDLVPGRAQQGDLMITKKSWGVFSATALDLELRRPGIRRIVLGGVATQFGVESTARQALGLGYELVIARDATASRSVESHECSMRRIFPRIARITDSSAVSFSSV